MPPTEVSSPGHFNPPSPTTWRRERLLHIGSSSTMPTVPIRSDENQHNNEAHDAISLPASTVSESTNLQQPDRKPSYGTISAPPNKLFNRPSLNIGSRRSSSRIPGLQLFRSKSRPSSPLDSPTTPSYSILKSQRPISTYDAPLNKDSDEEPDTRINGIRVWYSSFTSIDWLHDAIKDSARFARLRKRWLIVTLVGFLSAVVAFMVVRGEQWLFDLKEGYCNHAWWKAKRFCCFPSADSEDSLSALLGGDIMCPHWRTWSEVFGQTGSSAELVDYLSWTVVALVLATMSCLLTLYLTDSTTFTTRKESGVLKPEFADPRTPVDPSLTTRRKVMYYAAGSGIPEIKTILSGFVIHGYLGARTLFTKAVGLTLAVASGLTLGKEGPFVHIASCIGNIVSRLTGKYENNEAKRREILSAACAAGVAVAFGAPIGGTLFSLEEVSYFFPPKVMWRSFFCAMIAAITLKMLDPFGTGKLVLFQVTYDKDWHAFELVPFLFLGLFGGVYGAYFSKLNYRWSKNVRNKTWLIRYPLAEVLLTTLITTFFCFFSPFTRMGGTELVYKLFSECFPHSSSQLGLCIRDRSSFEETLSVSRAIFITMLVKGALTVITFGIKLPAGIFIPTLSVGACAGRILGVWIQWSQHQKSEVGGLLRSCGDEGDCIIPGLYAMVGAAAALSGVTRTTVSLAVIMFELTETLTYAVPVMLAVLVAKTVADALEPKGIYDLVIELNQLPFLDSKHEYLWGNLQINDVTSQEVDTIKLDERNTVMSLRDKLLALNMSENDDGGFPILRKDINEDGYRMVGYIGASELEHALSIVADSDADKEVRFDVSYTHNLASSSVSSLLDGHYYPHSVVDPFDFSIYMDQAPLTISSNSPMELLHQFFVKLGARYVVIADIEGLYEGVIDKKTWLAFLSDLEEKS
ncbi:H(+)/Cl(-) exchange transporter 3 [Leucoagaricus sp. SymC.cos]|nr:H(+)/Cl(-) exchange transporter 3 [Leucoagaricus sp. SymC.cos]